MCNAAPSLTPRSAKGDMQRASKWQAALAISVLLLTASVQGVSEAPATDRRTLLALIGRIIEESGRVAASRQYSAERGASRPASRERAAPSPRSSGTKRPSEFFSRDSTLKEKFINHFTAGPLIFSAECSKQFYRLYHNTKDCSTPAYYKRCARLLTRLAKSQLCSQP